ncbi:DUF2069 domain-containing protein [Idiomarina xiamenensis]|uniref:DUF2069 domain-containing protein n=1 Tax=Idiomarina xiamenensis 10-D-4 TaxID=740709 RepID=K2JTT6_9GAMM|nr:DUF2069 domain-containing protein [Idiomarina xiamenensis]EKE86856.1 hypothetical protein A10D4_01402 [Idiomarina xiamenensis 10-D-4]
MWQSVSFYRRLCLTSYLALLLFVILWHSALAPANDNNLPLWLAVLLWIVPLLLPLAGIIRGKPYTHAWANFILMWYFLHSLTTLYTHPLERGYAAIELLLTTLAFIGATGYARYAGRQQGLKIPKLKQELADEKARHNEN